MSKQKVYAIELSEHQGSVISLVAQDVWDWLQSPIPALENGVILDILPDELLARMKQANPDYNGVLEAHNPKNTRLIHATFLSVAPCSFRATELHDYLETENLELAGEMSGYL